MTGQVISHYRVLEKLGGGGMGVVYRAQDLRLKREVALKFLTSDPARDGSAIERFRREAEAISALNHPNICTLYDITEHERQPVLVLELLEGRTLERELASGPCGVERVTAIGLQVADALDAAHTKGIVHRDVKPANVWLTSRGDVKLLDFGIARLVRSEADGGEVATRMAMTAPGASIGTPDYMAPEQIRGQPADARTDLYAVGLLLYEMAAGRRAFSAIRPNLPPELEPIIQKLLENDPAHRYQTARDLMADLRRVARDSDSRRGPGRVEVSWKPRRLVVFAGTLLAVAIAAAGVWWMAHSRQATSMVSPGDPARLVVLPFENLTRQPEDNWLAGAFADALTAGLQPLEALVLVPRERVLELYASKSRQESEPLTSELARQISQSLRVRYYVHGSYQRIGDELRVTARLVDVEKDAIEAQVPLTDRMTNVFSLEDQLATQFATKLGARRAAVRSAEAQPVGAYQAVVDARTRYALGQFSEARVLLQLAVDQAPRYALAWAWLSKTDSRLASPASGRGKPSSDVLQQALTEATTADTLQSDVVDAKLALALAYRGLRMLPQQRESAARAAALDPHGAEAFSILADSYAVSATAVCPADPQPAEAERRYREALRLDPLSATGRQSLVTHLWWMNRQVEAFALMDEGFTIQPDNAQFKLWRPFNMAFAGRADEAFGAWRAALASPQARLDAFIGGIIETKRGNADASRGYFTQAGPQLMDALPFSLIAAVALLQSGRLDEGAALIERSLRAEPSCVAWFHHAPALNIFKDVPAVRTVLARIRKPVRP